MSLGGLINSIGKKDRDVSRALQILADRQEQLDRDVKRVFKIDSIGETGGKGDRHYTFKEVVAALKADSTLEE